MKDKVIQIGRHDGDLIILTKEGRVFLWEREFSGTVGWNDARWKEIKLPDLEKHQEKK